MYIYKEDLALKKHISNIKDLALNNFQLLIYHKPNQTKSYIFNIYV